MGNPVQQEVVENLSFQLTQLSEVQEIVVVFFCCPVKVVRRCWVFFYSVTKLLRITGWCNVVIDLLSDRIFLLQKVMSLTCWKRTCSLRREQVSVLVSGHWRVHAIVCFFRSLTCLRRTRSLSITSKRKLTQLTGL